MEIVQIVGIIVAATVILILAYLYRESAILEGKTQVSVGPWKLKLGGKAQQQAIIVPASPQKESEHRTNSEEAAHDRAES